MSPNRRANGTLLGGRKGDIALKARQDSGGKARARLLVRHTARVLNWFADVVQEGGSIHHLAIAPQPFFQILDPHDARGVEKMAHAMATKRTRGL